jgi:hypothetical protein
MSEHQAQACAPGAGRHYSYAQLHGKACVACAASGGVLVRAGYVEVEVRPGQPLGWAVAAHPDCLRLAS